MTFMILVIIEAVVITFLFRHLVRVDRERVEARREVAVLRRALESATARLEDQGDHVLTVKMLMAELDRAHAIPVRPEARPRS